MIMLNTELKYKKSTLYIKKCLEICVYLFVQYIFNIFICLKSSKQIN
mgnify:FL=1